MLSLDGLRAISISMVILGHFANVGYAPALLIPYGPVGVRVFFVISGDLITTILEREHERTSSISLPSVCEPLHPSGLQNFSLGILFHADLFAVYGWSLRWFEMMAAFTYLANDLPFRPWVWRISGP
jgi:hypothetical protein